MFAPLVICFGFFADYCGIFKELLTPSPSTILKRNQKEMELLRIACSVLNAFNAQHFGSDLLGAASSSRGGVSRAAVLCVFSFHGLGYRIRRRTRAPLSSYAAVCLTGPSVLTEPVCLSAGPSTNSEPVCPPPPHVSPQPLLLDSLPVVSSPYLAPGFLFQCPPCQSDPL